MSLLTDAVAAMKTVLLLEERIASQSRKLEQLANQMVDMERRLAMTEGRMEGFFAGASAFASSAAGPGAKVIDGGQSGPPALPRADKS